MKNIFFKLFLLTILSLQINVAWVAESPEQRGSTSTQSQTQVSEERVHSFETLNVYTHSHSSYSTSHIKALYIDSNVSLSIDDPIRSKLWTCPVITSSDDRYMRLLKETFVKYPGNNSPNHLIVSTEVFYFDLQANAAKRASFPMRYEGGLRDFCSAPPSLLHSIQIKLKDETQSETVVVSPGVELIREQDKITPKSPYNPFPILSILPTTHVGITNNNYPHSEIDALNALLFPKYYDYIFKAVGGKELVLGVMIKFISYNDICFSCQEAINHALPHINAIIQQQLPHTQRSIPLVTIGVVNHCYGYNKYYSQEEELCSEKPLNTNLKHVIGGMNSCLREGVKWEDLPQSHYNCPGLPFLIQGNYKPFLGTIHMPLPQGGPSLYIYVKQPDIRDFTTSIKPEFLDIF